MCSHVCVCFRPSPATLGWSRKVVSLTWTNFLLIQNTKKPFDMSSAAVKGILDTQLKARYFIVSWPNSFRRNQTTSKKKIVTTNQGTKLCTLRHRVPHGHMPVQGVVCRSGLLLSAMVHWAHEATARGRELCIDSALGWLKKNFLVVNSAVRARPGAIHFAQGGRGTTSVTFHNRASSQLSRTVKYTD